MLVITANTLRQQLTNTEGKDWGLGLNGSQNSKLRYPSFNKKNFKSCFDYISNSLLLLTFTYPLLLVSYALLLKFLINILIVM